MQANETTLKWVSHEQKQVRLVVDLDQSGGKAGEPCGKLIQAMGFHHRQ